MQYHAMQCHAVPCRAVRACILVRLPLSERLVFASADAVRLHEPLTPTNKCIPACDACVPPVLHVRVRADGQAGASLPAGLPASYRSMSCAQQCTHARS